MDIGMIGLGKMGGNMAQRLLAGGHRVVVYDPVPEAVQQAADHGAIRASSPTDLAKKLAAPRAVWLMVPAGDPTEKSLSLMADILSPNDIIIDGGNSFYQDSMRRAAVLKTKSIHFLDCGTSGGIWGLKEGYCLMVGGEKSAFQEVEPVFRTLAPAPDRGYAYVGPSGSGHFVKMVHNGIEYGLMESYAEGFSLLQAKTDFNLDLAKISELWRSGSVVRSWLLDLTARALQENPGLKNIDSFVEDSGEGRWTVKESIDLGIPIPAISLSLQARFRSRLVQPFGEKLLAALRNQFGGHAVKTVK